MAVYIPTNLIITKFTSRGEAYTSCKKFLLKIISITANVIQLNVARERCIIEGLSLHSFHVIFMKCTSFLMSVFITGYALFEIECHIKVTKHM